MDKLPCEVVRDLLPSYVDGLTSETTNRLVDEHMETCTPCRAALDAMRAPEETPPEGENREIDYLKKNKRRNRAVVLWSLAGALLLACAILFFKLFVVGEELGYGVVVPCNIRVEGNHLTAELGCMDSARVIRSVHYEEEDGVVTLRARGVLASFLFGSGAWADYTASAPIRQVRMAGGGIWWDDGVLISKFVSDIFQTRHDYVGDMPANGRTAEAIGVYQRFGSYENELHTSQRPYRWTITLQNDIAENERYYAERDMKVASCLMLAVIGNLDEVRFAYAVDGIPAQQTVTAEDASELLGQNVKNCAESVKLLEELGKAALVY